MSQSSTTALVSRSEQSLETLVLDDQSRVQEVLDLLDDPECRDILDATGDETLSAAELAETCDAALSTLYRKLDRLTDAGLLEERIRVKRSGRHTREYARRLEDVTLTVSDAGTVELEVARKPGETPTPRFERDGQC